MTIELTFKNFGEQSDELCVNGMSFSRRQSKWANSALVAQVDLSEDFMRPYTDAALAMPHKNPALAGRE